MSEEADGGRDSMGGGGRAAVDGGILKGSVRCCQQAEQADGAFPVSGFIVVMGGPDRW